MPSFLNNCDEFDAKYGENDLSDNVEVKVMVMRSFFSIPKSFCHSSLVRTGTVPLSHVTLQLDTVCY